jgi:UDP-3-O-[3-hydroxymyristoyl] glucosamine N-acyltransferase
MMLIWGPDVNVIHPTAIISKNALIGDNVGIGPYAIVGDATIGNDCVIHAHVSIGDKVVLGKAVEVFPGALIGKEPNDAGATARMPIFDRMIEIGDGCSIGPNAVVFYDVTIGSNTMLGDGASIREQCRIGNRCIISRYVTFNHSATVGDRTRIMDYTHITGHMVIGDDVFISIHVSTTNDNEIRSGYVANIRGPIVENGATISANAILLPGVTVGAMAMVGAGAVVTRNVPPNILVTGTPARYAKDMPAILPEHEEPDYTEFWNGTKTEA